MSAAARAARYTGGPRPPAVEIARVADGAPGRSGALADAAEAEGFIRHLLRLADDALVALDADDMERALAVVDERAACLEAAAAPLTRLAARRPPASGGRDADGADDLSRHVTELFDLAEALRASDAELTRRLQARRDRVAAELDRLGEVAAAAGAYHAPVEPPRLDLRG